MKAGASICTFCRKKGRLTREHIFRKNWQKHFGTPKFDMRDWGWDRDSTGRRVHLDRTYQMKAFERTVKAFCGRCNSGWMNNLENEAENLILPLVTGTPRRMTFQELQVVTRWAAKTAFVIETADRASRAARADQYRALRNGTVPPRFTLWMYPLIANRIVKTRSTSSGVVDIGAYDAKPDDEWRITSIQFFQVHLFSVHASTEFICSVLEKINLGRLCGTSVLHRKDGWGWPPAPPTPPFTPDLLHATVVKYIAARLSDAGMTVDAPIEVF